MKPISVEMSALLGRRTISLQFNMAAFDWNGSRYVRFDCHGRIHKVNP